MAVVRQHCIKNGISEIIISFFVANFDLASLFFK
jgi:hypothetical protein